MYDYDDATLIDNHFVRICQLYAIMGFPFLLKLLMSHANLGIEDWFFIANGRRSQTVAELCTD